MRAASNRVPDPYVDIYADHIPWFSSDVMETPLRAIPESKKSFLPSLSEKQKVGKMVHAIKMGWMKPRPAKKNETEDESKRKFYMLWQTDDQVEEAMRRVHDPIPAPKMFLPGHEESYNPPPEYLFTEKEKKEWERATAEGDKRKLPFLPQKFASLRQVPAWDNFIRERFERCLDLYLAPRQRKMRLTIQPEDLVPQLPKPKDLQPFPTVCSITFKGHNNMIRTVTTEPRGQYLASGCDDGTMKIWEVDTGRCLKTWDMGGVVRSVAWCPNSALSLVAVAVDTKLFLINTGLGDKLVNARTDELLGEEPDNSGYQPPLRVSQAVKWTGGEDGHHQPLQVCQAGDLARQGRLLRHGDAGWRQQIRDDPSVVQVEVPGSLQQVQGPGAVCPVPSHQTDAVRGHAATRARVRSGQAGADQETNVRSQVDIFPGNSSWRRQCPDRNL